MIELKFRYVLKGKLDNKIYYKWYYLKQIESGLSKLFDIDNYEIIYKNQYTGLKDKNSKEIYEGDLIKIEMSNKWIFKIVWDETYSCFKGQNIYDDSHDIIFGFFDGLEIIGNLHENPELLEESL